MLNAVLRALLPPEVLTINEFFCSTWAPIVVQLHTTGEGVLPDFLHQLTRALQNMPANEVYYTNIIRNLANIIMLVMLPGSSDGKIMCIVRRGKEREAAVALYMPGVREYVGGEFNEKELKDSIKRVGGTVNDSGLFLRPASSSIDVTSKTGLNRRSVVYIPRGKGSQRHPENFGSMLVVTTLYMY